MTDVIDSLKRLERTGSEISKTTEKLMTAARDLEKKIAAAFKVGSLGISNVLITSRAGRSYQITANALLLSINGQQQSVSATRANALNFSEDIAQGLLALMAENLEKVNSQVEKGAAALIAADLQEKSKATGFPPPEQQLSIG
ncbi:MAG: hypothetical protein WBW33_08555 [Bryobacteraceae bacterium]